MKCEAEHASWRAHGPALPTAMNPRCRFSGRMATALNLWCSCGNTWGSALSCLRAPDRAVLAVGVNGDQPSCDR